MKKANKLIDHLVDYLNANQNEIEASEVSKYLMVLSDLVGTYESKRFKFEKSEPREILAYLMEANQLKQSDLEEEIGPQSVVSEILSAREAPDIGECGAGDSGNESSSLSYARANGLGVFVWSWNNWESGGLIADGSGTPTSFGQNFSDANSSAPKLQITSPQNGSTITSADASKFQISGTCDSKSTSVRAWSGADISGKWMEAPTVTAPCTKGQFTMDLNLASLPNGKDNVKVDIWGIEATGFQTTYVSGIFSKDAVSATKPAEILGLISSPNFVFKHPAMLNNLEELQFIRSQYVAHIEPRYTNVLNMINSAPASLKYKASPAPIPCGGIYNALCPGDKAIETAAQKAAYDEITDAQAAYTQALLWFITQNEAYAINAAKILDAWSSVLKGQQGVNWYLEAAWAGSIFPLAAEILKSTYPKWQGADQFGQMLINVYLPILHNRIGFGNRELAVAQAMVTIGVYLDDKAAFYEGMAHWLSYVPEYYYLTSDGPTPLAADYWDTTKNPNLTDANLIAMSPKSATWIQAAPAVVTTIKKWMIANMKSTSIDDSSMKIKSVDFMWQGQNACPVGTYINGYAAEIGARDLGHTEGAFASTISLAEIAYHQGLDVYPIYADRLTAFMEVISNLRLGVAPDKKTYNCAANEVAPGESYPINPGNGISPTYETAYNHFHNIMGISLPGHARYPLLELSQSKGARRRETRPEPRVYVAGSRA
ncbi:unnamed protein product [Sphagnum balticum]